MYRIGKDAPGENIEVVHLAENGAWLRHERRENENGRRWPYWAFHADDLPAREVTFRFTDGTVGAGGRTVELADPSYRYDAEVVGPFGPAVSVDGVRWEWLGAEHAPDRTAFTYANAAGHKRVYFSIYLGYRPQNLDAFAEPYKNHPAFRASVLTVSE